MAKGLQTATFTIFKERRPTMGDKSARNPIAKFTSFGTSRKKAVANGKRLARNIFAGFYDDEGVFHPIRKSADYSRARVGEKKPKAKRKKKR